MTKQAPTLSQITRALGYSLLVCLYFAPIVIAGIAGGSAYGARW